MFVKFKWLDPHHSISKLHAFSSPFLSFNFNHFYPMIPHSEWFKVYRFVFFPLYYSIEWWHYELSSYNILAKFNCTWQKERLVVNQKSRNQVTEMFYCFKKWGCLQPQIHTHTHVHTLRRWLLKKLCADFMCFQSELSRNEDWHPSD